jgi:hypothetical protein
VTAPGPTRAYKDRTITRLVGFKGAAESAATRASRDPRDALTIAASRERWIFGDRDPRKVADLPTITDRTIEPAARTSFLSG